MFANIHNVVRVLVATSETLLRAFDAGWRGASGNFTQDSEILIHPFNVTPTRSHDIPELAREIWPNCVQNLLYLQKETKNEILLHITGKERHFRIRGVRAVASH
jgi:hypothetical protein